MKKSIVPEIVEVLAANNFLVELSEVFIPDMSPFTFLYNDTNQKGVILKEYNLNEEDIVKEINSDVSEVRNKLSNLKYNIWNIYFFIIDSSQIINKNIYAIERDYRSLRKYVINSSDELNRIPFISYSLKKNLELNISNSLYDELLKSSDKEINNLIQDVLENKGEHIEFKKSKVKELLASNLSKGEFE